MITHFLTFVVHFLHQINNNFDYVLLGSFTSMLTGEVISDGEITGHNTADVIIKIVVPIVTGVLITIVKNWIDERKVKNKPKKEN